MLQLFSDDPDDMAFQIEPGRVLISRLSKRWDAPTQDNPEGGIALRLQSIPSIEILQGRVSDEDSHRYRVLLLEYGSLNKTIEPEEDMEDDAFDWHNYVVAIMDGNDPDDCYIVNANNGADLDEEDLFKLRITLSQWANDNLHENYEAAFCSEVLETPIYAATPFADQEGERFLGEVPVNYAPSRN